MGKFQRSCPVCNEKKLKVIFRLEFPVPEDFALSNFQNVMACEVCGMVFSDSGNTQPDYNRYYESLSKYTGESPLNESMKKRFSNSADQVEALSDKNSRICDIGCGGGGLLHTLHERGFSELTGTDASKIPPESIRGHFRHLQISLTQIPEMTGEQFDVVTAIGVLEHLCDLDQCLENIRPMIKPNGSFYVEVPDASRYQETILSPFQDFNMEHINHFSTDTLSRLLERHGFSILQTKSILQPESANYHMPVIAIVAKNTPGTLRQKPDTDLLTKITKYIEISDKLLKKIDQYLEEKLSGDDSIIIWGAGQLGLKLVQLASLKKMKIEAFIDKSSGIKEISGVRVHKPFIPDNKNVPIIISSVLHAGSIMNDIQQMKITNPIIDISEVRL